jgi:hypothetical protein
MGVGWGGVKFYGQTRFFFSIGNFGFTKKRIRLWDHWAFSVGWARGSMHPLARTPLGLGTHYLRLGFGIQ